MVQIADSPKKRQFYKPGAHLLSVHSREDKLPARQPDHINALVDALERRWLMQPSEVKTPGYQVALRAARAVGMAYLEAQDVRHLPLVQRCEVIDRHSSVGGQYG